MRRPFSGDLRRSVADRDNLDASFAQIFDRVQIGDPPGPDKAYAERPHRLCSLPISAS